MLRLTSATPTTFLTGEEIPPNLLRLKPGDVVAWNREPRRVERVGYRLSAGDFTDEAWQLLKKDPAVIQARKALCQALGVSHLRLQSEVAYALAAEAGLGGPERGIHVDPCGTVGHGEYVQDDDGNETYHMKVQSTRIVKVGTYYAPQSYGDGGLYEYDDYEHIPGGLENMRPVVLVELDDGVEVLSGDLRLVKRAPRVRAKRPR